MTRVVLIVFLMLGWLFSIWKGHRAELRHQAASLRADSTAAANDRQRALFIAGLAYQARRIVQQVVERDSVDRALKGESRVRIQLGVQVQDLTAKLTAATTEDSSGARLASFRIRKVPYYAQAEVALPSPPSPGTLSLRIQLDSIVLRPRIVCGDAIDGVRPASLAVEGPTWAALRLEQLEQDPAVCNAEKGLPSPKGGRVPTWLAGVGIVVSWVVSALVQ